VQVSYNPCFLEVAFYSVKKQLSKKLPAGGSLISGSCELIVAASGLGG